MNKAKALILTVTLVVVSLYAQDTPNPAKEDVPPAKPKGISEKVDPATKAASIIWEYKTVRVSEENQKETERLNALGAEGWELVSVVYVPIFDARFQLEDNKGVLTSRLPPQLRYYFKRKLP